MKSVGVPVAGTNASGGENWAVIRVMRRTKRQSEMALTFIAS